MDNKMQSTREFLDELRKLLNKYNITIEAEFDVDHDSGKISTCLNFRESDRRQVVAISGWDQGVGPDDQDLWTLYEEYPL